MIWIQKKKYGWQLKFLISIISPKKINFLYLLDFFDIPQLHDMLNRWVWQKSILYCHLNCSDSIHMRCHWRAPPSLKYTFFVFLQYNFYFILYVCMWTRYFFFQLKKGWIKNLPRKNCRVEKKNYIKRLQQTTKMIVIDPSNNDFVVIT